MAKTMFLAIFVPCSSIVKSVFENGMILVIALFLQRTVADHFC